MASPARYIENGAAKIAPCGGYLDEAGEVVACSTAAILEKAYNDLDLPVWRCRNCGTDTKRRVRIAGVVAGTGGLLRLDADGNLV